MYESPLQFNRKYTTIIYIWLQKWVKNAFFLNHIDIIA